MRRLPLVGRGRKSDHLAWCRRIALVALKRRALGCISKHQSAVRVRGVSEPRAGRVFIGTKRKKATRVSWTAMSARDVPYSFAGAEMELLDMRLGVVGFPSAVVYTDRAGLVRWRLRAEGGRWCDKRCIFSFLDSPKTSVLLGELNHSRSHILATRRTV